MSEEGVYTITKACRVAFVGGGSMTAERVRALSRFPGIEWVGIHSCATDKNQTTRLSRILASARSAIFPQPLRTPITSWASISRANVLWAWRGAESAAATFDPAVVSTELIATIYDLEAES